MFRDGEVVHWEPYAIVEPSLQFTYVDLNPPAGEHVYQIYVPSKFLSSPILFEGQPSSGGDELMATQPTQPGHHLPTQAQAGTAKLALDAAKHAYDEDAERHRSIMSRTTSLISLAGVLLSVYAGFVLRLLVEAGVDKLDFTLALLTFTSLLFAFIMGLAVFVPRIFQRIDTNVIVGQEFLAGSEIEGASSLADVYNRLVEINDRVLETMFTYMLIGTSAVLAGLILISIQGVLLLAERLN